MPENLSTALSEHPLATIIMFRAKGVIYRINPLEL
ncbi:MAG: hypothetical protein RL248_1566 [Pseudomonadota bacterium]|jgi:hypothetical protein